MQTALARQPGTSASERVNLIDARASNWKTIRIFAAGSNRYRSNNAAALYLSGQLPTFYLKQLVQEILRRLPGVQSIRNEIVVVSPYGISSDC